MILQVRRGIVCLKHGLLLARDASCTIAKIDRANQFRQVLTKAMSSSIGSIQSNFTQVNGAKIHYEQVGTGPHKLLLLPGALGCSRTDFLPQLEHLDREKFTVIAWDPRGYGKSSPPLRDFPDFFYERDAEDAAGLMKQLGHESYSLIGWSDGGMTAFVVAARYPERIRKLVAWGSNAYITQKDIDGYDAVRDISTWSQRMRDPFLKLYGEEYFQRMWNENLDAFKVYFDKRGGNICQDELKKIACPTLIIHGVKDPLVSEEHPKYIHENIKGSRLHLIPEGKHNVHLRYYEEFNSIVQNFLSESKL